jgi:sulfate adenylyltransferase subunit 2
MSESILSKSENKAGRVLKENFMEPQNLSAYKLAKELNVPVSRIQDILKGRRKISADSSVKLGRYFNVSESYFLDLQNEDRIAEAGERNEGFTGLKLSHLDVLEAEAIYIMREVAAECEKPVMLYSIGKDSSVMLHLAMKAFYPEKPPFPFLHVNTTWKFKDMIEFRDRRAKELGIEMLEYINEEGLKQGINPFDHGAAYTDIMKTQALKQALSKYGFTAAFGGGRRDEEKSRAKERIFSFRDASQAWDPKNQRPEMWKCYNTEIKKGESIRVFPISNWTESDIWQYIKRENIPIVPLYFAAERPVVERDGNLIMVDDERMRLNPGEVPMMKKVRFRTLGCYPLSGGVESDAVTIDDIIEETLSATESERTSRVIDKDGGAASMEKRKREGYF